MQRNANAAQPFFMLLGAVILVAAPLLLSGLWEERAGRQARQQEQHEAAWQHFRLAALRLPWRGDLWEQAGMEAFLAEHPGEAVSMLRRAPILSAVGLLTLGQALQQTSDWDGAENAYQASLVKGATASAYAGLADVYRHNGDLEAERSALQNLLLFRPGDGAAQYRLGLLLSITDINQALLHLELASHLDDEYRPVFNTLRSALVLAKLKPSSSERYVLTGRALGLVNEWELAGHAFLRAVEADDQNAEAWAWLGEARQHLGLDGLTELDHALALDDHSLVVRGLRGLYWRSKGDEQQALTEFEAAAASEPENPAWMVSLGESHARLGDLVSALEDYERAVQMNPQDPLYWRLLALFCADYSIHIEDIGLPAAQKAVELSGDDPLNLAALGWLQLNAGQPVAARSSLEQAVETRPEDAALHYHLALALLQTGDRAAAREHLEAAILLDPQGFIGTQAAQTLKQQFP